jgi:hypothetical protein
LPNYFLRIRKLDRWFRMEGAFDERASNCSILCAYGARIVLDRSVADAVEHYEELPHERRRFADIHSFSVFSLDEQTHRIFENSPDGLHPGYESYPRAFSGPGPLTSRQPTDPPKIKTSPPPEGRFPSRAMPWVLSASDRETCA